MARVEQNILGNVRGKIGGIVGKVRNGKPYFASMPGQYTTSQKPGEVDKRNKFKVNGKFAKAIKESELLYRVWDKEKAPATNAYNKICMVNFKLCGTERPTIENVITPGGFDLPVTDVKSFPDRIEAELEPFNIGKDEKRITLILIVSFYEPERNQNNYFELRRIDNYEQDELKFTFKFTGTEKVLAAEYKNKTVYLAAITEDENGKLLRFSKTFGKAFDFHSAAEPPEV